jgi:hypothetical protein
LAAEKSAPVAQARALTLEVVREFLAAVEVMPPAPFQVLPL